jgi:hypothetical protein
MTKSILLLTSGTIALLLFSSCANQNGSTADTATKGAGTRAETGVGNVSGVGAGVGAATVPHIGGR